jgi:predicted unusual protein kinase regulating ubiquinone biosynthesis (AarF/ABC1/UbiB family)
MDNKNDKSGKKKSADEGLDKIKSSTFARGFSLAKLTVQAGASLAGHGVTTILKNKLDKEASWQDLMKSQAASIALELGHLKGSLMKAGQMLSMYGEHFLPPEANKLLKSLQHDSPPLKWSAIEPILKKQMPAELLAELDVQKESLASASMGQVHRARIKATGEEICLKIQYPHVDKAIESDLKALKTLLNTLKLLPKELNLDALFKEVREMLQQETDYELEARLTQDFYARLEGDDRFIVPKVYPRYSSSKILATSYEEGVQPDSDLVQNLSQERRNELARSYLDLYFKEIFEWGVVQTDPHSGNYKIRVNTSKKDQIILLDFGATREYPEDFMIPYRRMVKGSLYNDQQLLRSAALQLKFISAGDKPRLLELFENFCLETVEPFITYDDPRNTLGQIDADGNYDWKKTDLPQRLSKKVFQIAREFSLRTPPREIIFLDRKTGGVFIFLSILKAKIRGRDLLLPYMEKIKS